MAESTRLVDRVQAAIDGFLAERTAELLAITPELMPVLDAAGAFLSGGKRFRALFCYWGWHATRGMADEFDLLPEASVGDDLTGVVQAAAALEVFHAAALAHDDIMDRSDTRRGAPAAHRRFEREHVTRNWTGDAARFGESAAILLGDLLLGWSDELFDRGTSALSNADAGRAARAEFSRMRTEVTAGQFLDILEEHSWSTHPESDALSRAQRVIIYKSAKYSIEAPLAIGGALGGASLPQLAALRAFGLPLGIAYQLRDDLLGVFGDPAVTGKPAGDDLREGKRTVLIALARQSLPTAARNVLDELLGDPELDDQQIAMIRSSLRDCGATARLESIIDANVRQAREAIQDAPLAASARTELLALADTVIRRVA